ncbi:MAG: FtsW/RodA/SpoVE family cell cycle protein [Ignavibacteriales bacterium]|nr:MAG: FtsW/RodA/SpoVE family cell cycle protein [Ignavibacteriales bacterium]
MKKLALTVFFDVVLLMLLGLAIVMSASSSYSIFKFESLYHLFNSHLGKVLLGFGFMVLFAFIPYEIYKSVSKPAIIGMTVLLLMTLFVAPTIKGAGRWINLGFITFQPADMAKLVLIIHLAVLIETRKELVASYKESFIHLFFWIIIISGLVLIQPNISNAVILMLTGLTVLFVGGARLKHIIFSALGAIGTGLTAALLFPHSQKRIFTYINSLHNGGDINIQVKQALLGLGSGGLFGIGMGHSKQSNLFLPEAYGDFIFAILGEEMGFIGAVVIILSYLVLFVAGILIAKKAKDRFGQLLAFGITFSIILNAFINIAVATGLVPTTGLPLPFISYGGTSLIFQCIGVGILLNIAIANSIEQNKTDGLAVGAVEQPI